jgi:predicted xylose isomerase-like sugar epimerase
MRDAVRKQVQRMPWIQVQLITAHRSLVLSNGLVVDNYAQIRVVDFDEGWPMRVFRWHRVTICIDRNLAKLVHMSCMDDARSWKRFWQRPQRILVTSETVSDTFMMGAVNALHARDAERLEIDVDLFE